jgi:hypothetical protein
VNINIIFNSDFLAPSPIISVTSGENVMDLFYSGAVGNGNYDAPFPMSIGNVQMRIDDTGILGLEDKNNMNSDQTVMNRTFVKVKYTNLEKGIAQLCVCVCVLPVKAAARGGTSQIFPLILQQLFHQLQITT